MFHKENICGKRVLMFQLKVDVRKKIELNSYSEKNTLHIIYTESSWVCVECWRNHNDLIFTNKKFICSVNILIFFLDSSVLFFKNLQQCAQWTCCKAILLTGCSHCLLQTGASQWPECWQPGTRGGYVISDVIRIIIW